MVKEFATKLISKNITEKFIGDKFMWLNLLFEIEIRLVAMLIITHTVWKIL